VELAIVLPILLLILCGALDLGRAFYYQVNVSGAAREGARAASNPAKTDADVRIAVRNESASTLVIGDGNIAVSPSPNRVPGQPVTVTVSFSSASRRLLRW
jgi:Flp pilus assembly protein TadG